MISLTELNYVKNHARFTPYPGDEYALSVLEDLKDAYETYTESHQDKTRSFIFSDGSELEFTILPANLPHLLGIDTTNLTSGPMYNTVLDVLGLDITTRFNKVEFLNRIIERYEDVIKNDSNPKNYRILNYYKLMIRCAIFSKLTDFSKFDFGCIDLNKEAYNLANPGDNFSPNSTRYLFTPNDEAIIPYFMMGILYDEYNKIYVPETLFAPEDFSKFLKNQVLLLPIQILTSSNDTLTKKQATSKEKLDLLNLYKNLIAQYQTNTFVNIYNDYENVLVQDSRALKKIRHE